MYPNRAQMEVESSVYGQLPGVKTPEVFSANSTGEFYFS